MKYIKKILQYRNKIRSNMRILRKSLTISQQYDAAYKISKLAWCYDIFKKSKNIACFLAFDGEINLYPFMLRLWLNKKNIFVPIINSIYKKKLIFVPFTLQSIIYYNRYNIQEPFFCVNDVVSIKHLDVIIVPLVAFDLNGSRLGMGQGFYDNFLQGWKLHKIIPIGFAYDFQLVHGNIPKQNWDVSLPVVITPEKIHFFK